MQGPNVGPMFPIPPCLGSPVNRVAENHVAGSLDEEVEIGVMGQENRHKAEVPAAVAPFAQTC